eukprot:1084127-Amphidinium_carterae.1
MTMFLRNCACADAGGLMPTLLPPGRESAFARNSVSLHGALMMDLKQRDGNVLDSLQTHRPIIR